LHPEPGSSPPFGTRPLIVLTRDPSWGNVDPQTLKANWQVLQWELTQLSSNRRQEIAKGSGHYIHLSQPKLVIGAVRDVVFAVRSGRPLLAAAADKVAKVPN